MKKLILAILNKIHSLLFSYPAHHFYQSLSTYVYNHFSLTIIRNTQSYCTRLLLKQVELIIVYFNKIAMTFQKTAYE